MSGYQRSNGLPLNETKRALRLGFLPSAVLC